jgi:hypothetical protein
MNAYSADAESPSVPGKVDFGWLSQAFKLFGENAGLWISASLIAVAAPALFTFFIYLFHRVTVGVATAHYGFLGPTSLSPRIAFGVLLIDVVFMGFMSAGIAQMAVRKVSGQSIGGRDLFGGAKTLPGFLVFSVLFALIMGIGTFPLIVVGFFLAGLLLPVFAMISDGEPVLSAISKSVKAMWPDRWVATAFAFVLGVIAYIGTVLPLFGVPIYMLASALAYRDMIGLRNAVPTGPDILPWETADAKLHYAGAGSEDGDRVTLTGEPLDESGNPTPPARS